MSARRRLLLLLPLILLAGLLFAQSSQPHSNLDTPAGEPASQSAAAAATRSEPQASHAAPETRPREDKQTEIGLPADRATKLAAAFDLVAVQENADAARTILAEVDDDNLAENDWHDFYRFFFAVRPFTPGHAAFWDFALSETGEATASRAVAACRFTLEAIAAATRKTPPELESLGRGLQWLDRVTPSLNAEQLETVAKALREAFDPPLDLTRLLAPSGGAAQPTLSLVIQAALSLGTLLPPPEFVKFVTLPQPGLDFYARHGVFLFDGGLLNEAQVQSLASLLTAVPPQLHGVAAVLVPEGLGASATQLGLVAPRPILEISPVPIEITSNPAEFIPRVGQTVAPEFTLAAATELLRIIQRVQFARRPDLVMRRDALLERAGVRAERYLRRTIPPQAYIDNPDELLPLTGYLWMLDSARAFFMAMDLLDLRQGEAADALLLLADMLSGGGASTLMFRTDALGRISSQETPLRRLPVGPDLAYITGIGVEGALWSFELDVRGGALRCYRE